MYKVVSGGETIALVDEPRYIKLKESSGAFIQASKDDAQGIAVAGVPYNLRGHTEITRVIVDETSGESSVIPAPEAFVFEVDGGEVIFQHGEKIVEVDETAQTGLMATTDLYEELINKGVL